MVLHLWMSTLSAIFVLRVACNNFLQGSGEKFTKINSTKEDCIIGLKDENLFPTKVDYFSLLPDDILSSILSSLTLRDAVATSILSRRWRSLYASLPNLNFDMFAMFMQAAILEDPHGTVVNPYGIYTNPYGITRSHHCRPHICPRYYRRFVEGVNQMLKLYSGPSLSSFGITFCYKSAYAHDMDCCISWAIRLGVEMLDLSFVCIDNLICDIMYDYKTMVLYVFSLQRLCVAPPKFKHLRLHSCILKPDSSCRISTLTTLDLNYVPLTHDELQDMLSSCLNLEWLKLKACWLPDKLCFSGPSRLYFLAILHCKDVKEIELSVINLTTFEFSTFRETKMSFHGVPKLENIYLGNFVPRYLRDLAVDLPQMKTLALCSSDFWVQSLTAPPITYCNIKQFELFMPQRHQYDLVRFVTPLLSACPLLQRFYVAMPYPSIVGYERRTEDPPPCLHSQLREVEIGGLVGTSNEIEFAVCLLKNAVALERMIITAEFKKNWGGGVCQYGLRLMSEDTKKWICDELQGKSSSKNAKVIIRQSMEHVL